jgi:hypothetical protein
MSVEESHFVTVSAGPCELIHWFIQRQSGCFEQQRHAVFCSQNPIWLKKIRDLDCDILCLQELRDIPGANENPFEFLGEIAKVTGMQFIVVNRNQTRMSFMQAILWRPNRAWLRQSVPVWLSGETPSTELPMDANSQGYASVAQICVFSPLEFSHDSEQHGRIIADQTLCVANLHFLMKEEDKLRCAENVIPALSLVLGDKLKQTPCFVMGSINSFYDLEGSLMVKTLCGDFLENITRNPDDTPRLYDERGFPMKGTFLGTKSDPYQQPLDSPSHLDHVFIPTVENQKGYRIYPGAVHLLPTRDEHGNITRYQPSSRFPLKFNVRIVNPDILPSFVENKG